VIGISGASCSGKSWLARKLKEARPDAVTLFDLDSYYRAPDVVAALEYTHDNPAAINFDDAVADLLRLKNGQEIRMPFYNYETHRVDGTRTCAPAPIIVVEGMFVFASERLRKELGLKVWVDAGEDLRYERRMRRDTTERGRDVQDVRARYASCVTPGYQKYVAPLRRAADIVFENNGSDVTAHPLVIDLLLSKMGSGVI
jgi:uridine kinase